jgi:glucokinase
MSTLTRVLVFDIGGTNLRAGMYCVPEEKLTTIVRRKTRKRASVAGGGQDSAAVTEDLFQGIEALADSILGGEACDAIAVAWPGPISTEAGAFCLPTILGNAGGKVNPLELARLPFAAKIPIFHLNDVTAAGYRYLRDDLSNFCITTVSSGIGSKIFLNGRPLVGNGHGGEIGHWVVDTAADAAMCECGGRGHLGAIASGRAAVALAKQMAAEKLGFSDSLVSKSSAADPNCISAEAIASAFHQKDAFAETVVWKGASALGKAFALLHLGCGVSNFIVYGGFGCALGIRYCHLLAKAAATHCWNSGIDWPSAIRLGIDDDNDALIGGARFALRSLTSL